MIKKIISAIFASAIFFSPVQALQVYEDNVGQWKIHGHIDGENTACVLSTFWPDSSQVNINVFPRGSNEQYTTMTLYRPSWNGKVGASFRGYVRFYSNAGTNTMVGQFDVITPNKVITRTLSREFSDWFIASRVMTVFPETPDELSVGLRGTSAAMSSLAECMSRIR